jgi:serine/threonine protein kinase
VVSGVDPQEGRRYQIREVLGKGGFGTVYRADLVAAGGFSRAVALKVLNADMEGVDDVARRLRDEARVLGKLGHRAIVHVDGLIVLDGRWTVVMEYVHGVDLKTIIAAGPVPVGPALEITHEVAAALHVAFEKATPSGEVLRLLHRDIKPANIQITSSGDVKVLDFGIARAEFSSKEAVTRSVTYGSLPYMSPERLDFEDSHAGDVYAIGTVLYEMLVGDALGKTSASDVKHEALRNVAIERLRDLGIDEPVVGLVASLLAYEPSDRPTAKECERQLRQLRQRYAEPPLAEFAEQVVPGLLAHRIGTKDDLSGKILHETTGARREVVSGLPPSPPQTGARGRVVAGALAFSLLFGAALLTAVAVVIVALVFFARGEPEAPPPPVAAVTVPSPALTAEPEVVADPTPVLAPRVAPPRRAAKVQPPVAMEPKVEPSVPLPAAEPVAEPTPQPARGRVTFTGEATEVVLVDNGLRLPVGDIAPGTYEVRATFPGRDEAPAGKVTVAPGAMVTLKCSAGFFRCVAR